MLIFLITMQIIEIKRLVLLTTINKVSIWFFQVPWLSHQYPVLPGYHLKLTEYLESHNSTYLNIQQCKSSSIDSLFTISFQVVRKLRPNNEDLSKITLIKIDGGNFFLNLGLFSFHECKTCALKNLRLVVPKGRSSADA